MNPVNRFDNEGLPVFYVKDIPPVGPPELKIDRPRVGGRRMNDQTDDLTHHLLVANEPPIG